MKDSIKVFRSRISIILWVPLFIFLLGMLFLSIRENLKDPSILGFSILLIIWIPTYTLIFILLFGTKYILTDEKLIIKIGPIRHSEIEIKDLYSASRSYSIIGSPANSLKRLKLEYDGGEILISPVQESEFIKQIKKLNPKFMILKFDVSI